ncbi:MAG: tyrosine-protein phosphatase [Treponema sp.]|nr:tyrosine-protein phosphatase [Treponema sp.]
MAIIHLKGARNFRDLGGIKTKDGRTVKPNMLIRGTPLVKLHKKDIELLKMQYGLSTVIDLRTKKEAEERPNEIYDNITYLLIPILDEGKVGISHEKKVRSLKTLKMMMPMEDLYISMVTGASQDNLIRALKTILTLPEKDFSVVFHCTAGKDRTGILASMLLSFLGADREVIINDYLLSNKGLVIKAHLIYLALLILKFNPKLAGKIRLYNLARRSFIEAALNSLEEQYDSVQNFLQQKLEFTEEEANQIRNKFLE